MRLAALNTLRAAIDVPPLSHSGRCTTVEYKSSTSCGDFGEAKGICSWDPQVPTSRNGPAV